MGRRPAFLEEMNRAPGPLSPCIRIWNMKLNKIAYKQCLVLLELRVASSVLTLRENFYLYFYLVERLGSNSTSSST